MIDHKNHFKVSLKHEKIWKGRKILTELYFVVKNKEPETEAWRSLNISSPSIPSSEVGSRRLITYAWVFIYKK